MPHKGYADRIQEMHIKIIHVLIELIEKNGVMAVAKTWGSAVYGVNAAMITIELTMVQGTKFFMVGLPDNAIKESQHRIESTLKHINYTMPRQRIIVNLAPADIRKEGAAYDLPIALCILQASKQSQFSALDNYVVMGELGLNGQLRPIRGVLPIAIAAQKNNAKALYCLNKMPKKPLW